MKRTHPALWALAAILAAALLYGIWDAATYGDRLDRAGLRMNIEAACQGAINYSDCMARAHQKP